MSLDKVKNYNFIIKNINLLKLLFDVDEALISITDNVERLLTVATIYLPIFIVSFAIFIILLVALLIVSIFLQFKRLRLEYRRRNLSENSEELPPGLEKDPQKVDKNKSKLEKLFLLEKSIAWHISPCCQRSSASSIYANNY